MAKLTEAGQEMLALVIENPAVAWTTSPDGPTADILRDWEKKGYFEEVEAPAPILVAYRITNLGRQALTGNGRDE